METISNMANAAAQAVWPDNNNNESTTTKNGHSASNNTNPIDSHEEPLSGVKGNTANGEPYDAGNKAEQDMANTLSSTKASEDPMTPKLDGPGPRPVEEVARENGGDAGRATTVDKTKTANKSAAANSYTAPVTRSGRQASTTTNTEGGAPLQGTGEKYVKSTGVSADGGDFDASNPGAGREAGRLMHEQGIHPSDNSSYKSSHDSKIGSSSQHHEYGNDHMSLGEKIKAKVGKT